MPDYDEACRTFTWAQARGELAGLPDGKGLNIGYEAVDRQALGDRAESVALRCIDKAGDHTIVTYAELLKQTSRFANLLARLGVGAGDSVFSLLARGPDLYVAALGTLRYTAVFSPLFSAFGPEPIRQRLSLGSGVALVTTPEMYRAKVAPIRDTLPTLRHVLVTGDGPAPDGTTSLKDALNATPDGFQVPATEPDQPALLHFTSGTTGLPKGAVHVHEAVVAHRATARYALGPSRGRRVLVHGRSRLGHWNVVRRDRAVDDGGHRDRGRGRV